MLTHKPRAATVYAVGKTRVAGRSYIQQVTRFRQAFWKSACKNEVGRVGCFLGDVSSVGIVKYFIAYLVSAV